jgi:hypothetical protein
MNIPRTTLAWGIVACFIFSVAIGAYGYETIWYRLGMKCFSSTSPDGTYILEARLSEPGGDCTVGKGYVFLKNAAGTLIQWTASNGLDGTGRDLKWGSGTVSFTYFDGDRRIAEWKLP